MNENLCRLCYSNNIKSSININDTLIQTLADFVPEIVNKFIMNLKLSFIYIVILQNLSKKPSLPITVCQLCQSKANICIEFISKIKNTEKLFIKNNQ